MGKIDLFGVVQLLASVGTFIAAIIATLTLRELKEQRRSSTRPEIVVSRTNYNVYIVNELLLGNISWFTEENTEIDLTNRFNFNVPTLKMYNIGLAAAKDIKLEWKYDINKIINTINNDPNNKYKIEKSDRVLRLEDSLSILFKEEDFDYLLPVNINNQLISFRLPPDFVRLISLLLIFDIQDIDNKDNFYLMELPEVQLVITYNDISNNSYSKILKISFGFQRLEIKNIGTNKPVLRGEIKVVQCFK